MLKRPAGATGDAIAAGTKRERPVEESGAGDGAAKRPTVQAPREEPMKAAPAEPPRKGRHKGSGTVLSRGRGLQGQGTRFRAEVEAGDAVEVEGAGERKAEIRVVEAVLDDRLLMIHAPLASGDLLTPTAYWVLKLPRAAPPAPPPPPPLPDALPTYGPEGSRGGAAPSTTVVAYDTRTPQGGYKHVTEVVDRELTREELLDLRSKKRSDRRC